MSSTSKISLIRTLAPKLPSIASATAAHSVGYTETSSKWDVKTALIMAVIRAFLLNPKPSPLSRVQRLSTRDPGIKGPIWVSKQIIEASSSTAEDVLRKLMAAVEALADNTSYTCTPPTIQSVSVEWTTSRSGVGKSEPRLKVDENSQYTRLMSEVTSEVTVLYLHGGALYLMDPATHRVTVGRIAKRTGGRCMSVRYRLAPQNPFPSALLDCLIAYLSLLSPPDGSIHAPVPAEKIVFAGDSAGGNLSLSLLFLIVQMHRQNNGQTPVLNFHGKEVPLLMPGGVAVQSPWVDLTRSMPSNFSNMIYDYLPAAKSELAYERDAIWPSNPPRADLYCDASMLCHPLVSPITAHDWRGAPPVFICVGEECLADEGKVIARRLATSGVKTEFWQYEAMPHVFPAIFSDLKGANEAMDQWADAIVRMAAGGQSSTEGTWVQAKTLQKKRLLVLQLASHLSDNDIHGKMRDAQSKKTIPRADRHSPITAKL